MLESRAKSKQDLSKDFQSRINQANGRLRSAQMGVLIQRLGNKLYLQATLPPRPGADRQDSHQQRIALGKPANPAGLSEAEKAARLISVLVTRGEFSWEPYLKTAKSKPETVSDWVERFAAEYQGTVKPVTWASDYQKVFRTLPDAPLTFELLQQAVMATKANSRTRKRFATALGKLAAFAGLEGDFKGSQGNYSASQVEPRDLPDDRTIVEWFEQLAPSWQWVYGVMAAFGLRNHEAFYLDIAPLEQGHHWVRVLEGKTGYRVVWAYYPEWVDQFGLRTRTLPNITADTHDGYGRKVSKYLGAKLPFKPYSLRHCWAIRTVAFGLDPALAAKQMGHSLAVHEQTYQRWIPPDFYDRVFHLLISRPDRPLPPEV
jgi:integrase